MANSCLGGTSESLHYLQVEGSGQFIGTNLHPHSSNSRNIRKERDWKTLEFNHLRCPCEDQRGWGGRALFRMMQNLRPVHTCPTDELLHLEQDLFDLKNNYVYF